MCTDEIHPSTLFIFKLLISELEPLSAHGHKTGIIAAVYIFFQGHGLPGSKLVQNLTKEGVIDF